MSRSYRHHFVFPTEKDSQEKKRFNRRLRRRHIDVASNSGYKKANNSWAIRFGIIRYLDEEDFVRQNLEYGDSEEKLRKIWRKYFLSK